MAGVRSRKQKSPHAGDPLSPVDAVTWNVEPTPTAAAERLSEIAGYQLGRKLGTDADADLYLGHSAHGAPGDGASNNIVTLKLFRTESASSQIDHELAVRSVLVPGSIGALHDVATLADGRVVLVLEHLAGGSLVHYLRAYTPLSPGEAVTILAPIVSSLAALHEAGFALPDLSVTAITLTAEGRPVIDRFGALELLPPPATAARVRRDLLRNDYERLIRVMREVFAAVDPASGGARHAEGIAGWGEEAADHLSIPECLDGLEAALFAWAPGEALRMRRPVVAHDAPLTDFPLRRIEQVAVPPPRERAVAERPPPVVRFGIQRAADRIATALRGPFAERDSAEHGVAELSTFSARLRKRLLSRPILVAAALAIGLSSLAFGALSTGAVDEEVAAENSDAVTAESDPLPIVAGTAAEREAIAADDPVAAAMALLAMRAVCLAESSVLCLDTVDQAGSAAMAADRNTVRIAQQNAGDPVVQVFEIDARLVERNGDSALVEVTMKPAAEDSAGATAAATEPGEAPADERGYSKPASLLVIRGEAGWRVREIFDY